MQHNLTPGLLIKDRYKLMQRIGQGSFGEVWLADDLLEQKYVAIKMYQWLDRDGMETFAKEMETTKDLVHPNLLIPSEFNEWNQRPFFVMEYCGKGSASQIAGQLNEDMAWRFIRDVASGLAYLHGLYEPIVHQDVKPYNIVISDDNSYKITDFGISTKVRDHLARHSDHRNPNAGALAYMAPERFTPYSSPITSSDIWAFGVTIYELLSGRLPFNGMGGGMLKGGAEIPHIPAQYSEQLDRLVTACLQKDTWDRPTAEDIERYAEAMLRGDMPVGRWEIAAAAAAPIAPGISEEIKEMGEQKDLHERDKGKRWMVVAATIVGIVAISGLIWAAIDSIPDDPVNPEGGEVDLQTSLTTEENLPENLLAENTPASDYSEEVAEEELMAEDQEPGSAITQEAPGKSNDAGTAATSQAQKEDTRPRQTEPQATQPSTAGSGYAVTPSDGYRGPEDTGRPQNKVNQSDYRGKDRNGFVSRSAAPNPAANKYAGDPRVKKPGDVPPVTKSKTTSTVKKKEREPMREELRNAISSGDYAKLKSFADAGDANAYVPMADMCLRNHKYADAEGYAKKAQTAGVGGAARIFKVLREMGYYD